MEKNHEWGVDTGNMKVGAHAASPSVGRNRDTRMGSGNWKLASEWSVGVWEWGRACGGLGGNFVGSFVGSFGDIKWLGCRG